MRIIRGFKIGGLQQKIINMVLIALLLLVGGYVAVTAWHQNNLTEIVRDGSQRQQQAITSVSKATMEAILEGSVTKSTMMQAYIADDFFGDVREDVRTMQALTTELFKHQERLSAGKVDPPSAANEGVPSAQLISEAGADPENSEFLGIVANMSDYMISLYKNSDKMSSIFIGTADGHMVLVNDRPGVFLTEGGKTLALDIRHRPWYMQAATAGELTYTGVVVDAYTENLMLECAAPVYYNGELVAVVAADVYLNAISEYADSASTEDNFVFVINEKGQVLFAPERFDSVKAVKSIDAPDLRKNENKEFAAFVAKALKENTGIELIKVGDEEYYLCGAPIPGMGWTVISVVSKALTEQPTAVMLAQIDQINQQSVASYEKGAKASLQTFVVLTIAIILLSFLTALILATRVVKPLEHMTQRMNSLHGGDDYFQMEDIYKTGDEVEVLAQAFATLSKRAREYVSQILSITAEKERIGTELALATRIQADMLPNIYPAFPERNEFDIYASMDPAKEVGGDFYDFFLVDDDHLCMVMADVSGKGVPAALFMMASKIILANNAMLGKSPAKILTDTNAAICSNNREEMFVTVWLGILELSTGKLTAANAGHEYPVIKRPDGPFELLKDKHGFVIGGMDGMKYKEYELTLEPGAKLFLYTDGVPEATDANKELFGTERMLEALNQTANETPEMILKNVRIAVDGFVKEAEQFDDLTMLCLAYTGKV